MKSSGNTIVDLDPTTLRPLYGKLTQKRFTDELSSASLEVGYITVNGQLGNFQLVFSTTGQNVDAALNHMGICDDTERALESRGLCHAFAAIHVGYL